MIIFVRSKDEEEKKLFFSHYLLSLCSASGTTSHFHFVGFSNKKFETSCRHLDFCQSPAQRCIWTNLCEINKSDKYWD